MQIMRSAQVLDKLQFGAIALITIAQVYYCVNVYCANGYCANSIHPK
jgi:hypothetical protein